MKIATSGRMTRSVDNTARKVAALSTTPRRRALVLNFCRTWSSISFLGILFFSDCRTCFCFSALRCRCSARDRPDEQAGDCVHDNGDDKERKANLDERAQVHVGYGLSEFVGNDGGH